MENLQYQKLLDDTKAYLNTRYDLLRLSLLEKLSKVLGLILLALVMLLLVFAVLSFAALALVFVVAQWLPTWSAFLIVGALFLLLMVLALVFRRQWFINPMIGALSAILFMDEPADPSADLAGRKEAQDD